MVRIVTTTVSVGYMAFSEDFRYTSRVLVFSNHFSQTFEAFWIRSGTDREIYETKIVKSYICRLCLS